MKALNLTILTSVTVVVVVNRSGFDNELWPGASAIFAVFE
jgi:hypothetical protein